MERNSDHQTKKTVRPLMSPMTSSQMMSPMTSPMMSPRMSLDAIHTFDQMKLKKKSSMKPKQSSPSSSAAQHPHHHRHRHHHQQAINSRRSSHAGLSEEQRPKSVSASPASAAASQMRRVGFASGDQHPIIRPTAAAAAAVEKHCSGKKSPTAATGRNSILSKTASINQSTNHSFLLSKQQDKQDGGGGIRSREQQPNACRRTSMPMSDIRKHVSSASLPLAQHPNRSNISSREANAMNRMRDGALMLQMQQRLQQQEKPFRISPMGYDSRYEDVIYESQRCVDDDDIAPEGIAQAIDKCRLWLKKHHVDNYHGGRRASYYH